MTLEEAMEAEFKIYNTLPEELKTLYMTVLHYNVNEAYDNGWKDGYEACRDEDE